MDNTTQTQNGSRISLWSSQPTSERSPVARGTVRLSVPMLQDLMARAQAGNWSGTDDRSGPYLEVRWSGFAVSSQNANAPRMSGPVQTISEFENRNVAPAPAGPPAGFAAPAPAGGPPAPAPAAGQWGAPGTAAPQQQPPSFGGAAPQQQPPAAAPAQTGFAMPF